MCGCLACVRIYNLMLALGAAVALFKRNNPDVSFEAPDGRISIDHPDLKSPPRRALV